MTLTCKQWTGSILRDELKWVKPFMTCSPVPKAWYKALLPGLTPLLDTMSSLPYGVAETLQCIELFAEAFWQALPCQSEC